MITFWDGPAKGEKLSLGRAPEFLRVVIDADGTIDALDQLDDQPEPDEEIYVYRQIPGTLSGGFACTRGKGCRRLIFADYRLCETQPEAAVLRDNVRWQAWCHATWEGEHD